MNMLLPPGSFPPDNDALLSSDDEFVAACLKMLRGELEESACKALAKQLDADADKRRLYVQLAMQSQMIGEVLALHPECDESDANDESHDPYAADIMAEVADSIRMQRHADQVAKEAADLVAQEKATSERKHQEQLALMRKGNDRPVTRQYIIPKIVAGLSMAAAVGLVAWLGYALFNPPSTSQTASDDLDPPTHIEQPPAPRVYVARVDDSYDAQWEGFDPADGRLELDKQVVLLTGIAEITFEDGATVLIEAPATFKATGPNAMRFIEGRLAAEVPESAHGFVVELPHGQITDLGTAFGLNLSKSGFVEAVVFEGIIEVQASDAGQLSAPVRLAHGQGAVMEEGSARFVSREVEAGLYARDLESARRKVRISRGGLVLDTAPASVEVDRFENSQVVIFRERKNVRTSDALICGITEPGQYSHDQIRDLTTLLSPCVVDSYLLHFDSERDFSGNPIRVEPVMIQIEIIFPRPVVGLMTHASEMISTDSLLGHPDTAYDDYAGRTLVERDSPSGNDTIWLSEDRRTLRVWIHAVNMDQLRILIESSEVE